MENIESKFPQIVGSKQLVIIFTLSLSEANDLAQYWLNIFHIFLVLFYQIPSFISVAE